MTPEKLRELRAYLHRELTHAGHLVLWQQGAVECARCGRSGSAAPSATRDDTLDTTGAIFRERCGL